jgi:hypothetical protein
MCCVDTRVMRAAPPGCHRQPGPGAAATLQARLCCLRCASWHSGPQYATRLQPPHSWFRLARGRLGAACGARQARQLRQLRRSLGGAHRRHAAAACIDTRAERQAGHPGRTALAGAAGTSGVAPPSARAAERRRVEKRAASDAEAAGTRLMCSAAHRCAGVRCGAAATTGCAARPPRAERQPRRRADAARHRDRGAFADLRRPQGPPYPFVHRTRRRHAAAAQRALGRRRC